MHTQQKNNDELNNKPYLDYIEYHVSHHCNLRCIGCSHYSNEAKAGFGNYDNYKRDLKRLMELFSGIRQIRLLGGEPFLNMELGMFIVITRQICSESDIRVVTNGLLIPKIKKEVLNTIRDNNVKLDISLYPPTLDIKSELESLLDGYDVRYQFSPLIKKFKSFRLEQGTYSAEDNYKLCESRNCHFLEDGKIAICPRPIVYKRKKVRDERIDLEMKKNIIDLYDNEIDGNDILKRFSKPIDICKYCNTVDSEMFDWRTEE